MAATQWFATRRLNPCWLETARGHSLRSPEKLILQEVFLGDPPGGAGQRPAKLSMVKGPDKLHGARTEL